MQKPLFTILKITLFGFSLPWLFAGNSWAKTCTKVEVNAYLNNSNDALFDCNANTVPVLIEALNNDNAKVRSRAVNALLFQVGIQDQIVVPALVNALKDRNAEVRQSAASGLAIAAIEADTAVPVLIESLKDENPQVRSAVALALRNSGTKAEIVVPALIRTLEDSNANVRGAAAIALADIGADTKIAIPALIKALKDDNAAVRSSAAVALRRSDTNYKAAIPELIEALKDQYAHVRSNAALGIRAIGVEDKTAISPLIHLLNDENPSVRGIAAYALGLFSSDPNAVLPVLLELLKDKDFEVRKEAARSLKIAANQYGHTLTRQQTDQALTVISTIKKVLADPSLKNDVYIEEYRLSVARSLESLQNKRQSFLVQSAAEWLSAGRNMGLAHAAFWLALIFAYPRSPQIQAIFFWNPWVRNILGVGYVPFLLAWIPFLRRKLFEPFQPSLLADAGLANFSPDLYFSNSTVQIGDVNQAIATTLPHLKGQIILEGDSGLGKTMFVRHLLKQSKRIAVYLPAVKCTEGVIEAIQKKLHGDGIKDPKFLQSLIYSGAIDIYIDGLNEVSADTRAKIAAFVESHFRGNILITTQPLEWNPPATAKTYVLQPLQPHQIEAYLLSRHPFLPKTAPVRGKDYQQACRDFSQAIAAASFAPEERQIIYSILSNPMELTLAAWILADNQQPNLFNLRQQQYDLMAADYQRMWNRDFPLNPFSKTVYQLRLADQQAIPAAEFYKELQCMEDEKYRMVISRQWQDAKGEAQKEWVFRHDKIAEFFIVQTFLGNSDEAQHRLQFHIGDSRFRGVYFLLATLLPIDAAQQLREDLINYAADTKDHTVSDTFVQLMRSRKAIPVSQKIE